MESLMKKLLLVLMLGLSSLTLQGANVDDFSDDFSDDFDFDGLLQANDEVTADELRLAMQAAEEENLFADVGKDLIAAVTKDYRNRGENTFLPCVCCNELIPLKKLNRHVKACKEPFRKFPPLLPTPALPPLLATPPLAAPTVVAAAQGAQKESGQDFDAFKKLTDKGRFAKQEAARKRHAVDQAGPEKTKKKKFKNDH